MTALHAPPQKMIDAALDEGRKSPCAKVKRGAVVFDPRSCTPMMTMVASGFNGPPAEYGCDGSFACAKTCSQKCAHAEARAVRLMIEVFGAAAWGGCYPRDYDILHVKLDHEDKLAASGAPRCWQCARDILDVGLGGVWMYETETMPPGVPSMSFVLRSASWKRYTAREFYEATAKIAGIHL